MTQVADAMLGKIARQQNDLFRRVREGAIDPELTSRLLQDIIQQTKIFYVNVDYDQPEAIKAAIETLGCKLDFPFHLSVFCETLPLVGKGRFCHGVKPMTLNRGYSVDDDLLLPNAFGKNTKLADPLTYLTFLAENEEDLGHLPRILFKGFNGRFYQLTFRRKGNQHTLDIFGASNNILKGERLLIVKRSSKMAPGPWTPSQGATTPTGEPTC